MMAIVRLLSLTNAFLVFQSDGLHIIPQHVVACNYSTVQIKLLKQLCLYDQCPRNYMVYTGLMFKPML